MNEIYLVTGAAGFLGGTVCRKLVERGEKVRAFVLPHDRAMRFVPKEAEIREGDLCDMASLERFFDVPDDTEIIVIHCASIVTVNPEYSQKVMDVNVGGTINILSQCQSHSNFRKLVYVSSTGCIPEIPKGKAIKEVRQFYTDVLVDCYSQSKALATQAVLDACDNGLNACIVHPSGILGPEDFAVGLTTKVLIQIIKGEMFAAISGSFNLADVRDLASGVIGAADNGRMGECYILANEVVSFKNFARLISDESGCKKMKFFIPGAIAYRIAGIMEKRAERNGSKPMMTTYSIYNLARNNVFDSAKAKEELGYTTRPYRETIHDEIAWLKSEGLI
ncbi:MAG: NAD-dependent epimerase/dehydratase family protein [Bacteroidales bacterium]|jgi:dihydroflavonol-4-reductase|nr:NAD-dependent epimerase/dehydratase family protein [Bacteroidales bacterium]